MGILAWLIVGLIAVWLARRFMKGEGPGLVVDMAVGLGAAVVVGYIASAASGIANPLSAINVGAVVVALLGGIVAVVLIRILLGVLPARTASAQSSPNLQTAFVSNYSRAQWTVILLSIVLVVDLIAIISDLAEVGLLSRALQGETISLSEANANDSRQQVIGVVQVGLFIATGVMFCFWIHRAHKNLPAFGVQNLRFSPGWAVGGFFVPILNLVRPVQVVTEIWKASDPNAPTGTGWQNAPGSPLIGFWWLAYVVSSLVGNVAARLATNANTLSQIMTASQMTVASDFVSVGAAILAILVVREIDRRQEEKGKQMS
jgi:uncharacterized membrane protein YeaQ/YmgE (transglycosylase-associated protein family)